MALPQGVGLLFRHLYLKFMNINVSLQVLAPPLSGCGLSTAIPNANLSYYLILLDSME